MDITKLNKPTSIKDIDFRVQSITEKGYCTLLGYKDARYDRAVLDDAVGALNWGNDFKEIKGHLYAGVWVRDPETKKRVWKWDVGTESNTEATKGEASDAFKRACFKWGIGADLYDLPQISFMLTSEEFTGKNRATYKFKPNDWTWTIWEDDSGNHLAAKDTQERVRYDSRKDFNPAP